MQWFTFGYWKYLLGKADNPHFCSKWKRFWCRVKGHPMGAIYYTVNPTATEPDYRCKTCGDEL